MPRTGRCRSRPPTPCTSGCVRRSRSRSPAPRPTPARPPAAAAPATSPMRSASPQCSTGSQRPAVGVVREGGVADGVQPRERGGHGAIGDDATPPAPDPAGPRPTSCGAARRPLPGPGRPRRRSRRRGAPRGRPRRPRTSMPPRSRTPSSCSHCPSRAPAWGPSRACCGRGSLETSVTSCPVARSDAAASQPMKPDPTTTTDRCVLDGRGQGRACPYGRKASARPGGRRPRGKRLRRAAHGQHARLIGHAPASRRPGPLPRSRPTASQPSSSWPPGSR